MFDIGWTEMLVVAVVAILFVGPKELPAMLRTFGKAIKKVRMLAGDFQKQFDDALKDAELDGVKSTFDDVRNLDPTKSIKDKLNPLKSELDDVKKSVESSNNSNGDEGSGDSSATSTPEPAKIPPSSGKNAVPGFGGAPVESSVEAKPDSAASTKKAPAKNTAASAKKPAKAATKPKPTAAKSSGKTSKTAAKPKPARKTSA